MKKHLEYLRNGTALVTLFVERSFTGPRHVKRKPAVNMNAAGQIFGRGDRTARLAALDYAKAEGMAGAAVANYGIQGESTNDLIKTAFPSSFPG